MGDTRPFSMITSINLQEWFGPIDIYLFDQLLKGRFTPEMRILDAGCGGGRNLIFFLRSGHNIWGVDQSSEAIAHVKAMASELAPQLPSDHFRVEPVEGMSFADASFNVVISSAVLHFATDEKHWQSMVDEMWSVLRPSGMLFVRLASSIGIEHQIEHIKGRRYLLPDGSERFLADEQMLMDSTKELGGELIEPLKTVIVQHMRAMTTWCLRKL